MEETTESTEAAREAEEDQLMADVATAENFIENHAVKMLEYEKQMFLDALHSDALIVCAK